MKQMSLSEEQLAQIEHIYGEIESEYNVVAKEIGFTCEGCSDNCCDSYFLHHTYLEWAYLWHGFLALAKERQEAILSRCRDYMDGVKSAEAAGERPQIMCPLNDDGLCSLYRHRLLVCRSHGVPAIMRFPNGQSRHFMGCFRCQELVVEKYQESEIPPHVERTPQLQKLLQLENQFCLGNRAALPKVKMSIAEMLLAGPPHV